MNFSQRRKKWYREAGHRLRVLRHELGISENDMAEVFGITLRTYRARESGRPWKGGHQGVIACARKYKVSYDWLLDGQRPIFVGTHRAAA